MLFAMMLMFASSADECLLIETSLLIYVAFNFYDVHTRTHAHTHSHTQRKSTSKKIKRKVAFSPLNVVLIVYLKRIKHFQSVRVKMCSSICFFCFSFYVFNFENGH